MEKHSPHNVKSLVHFGSDLEYFPAFVVKQPEQFIFAKVIACGGGGGEDIDQSLLTNHYCVNEPH